MPGRIRKDVDEVVERLRKADSEMFEKDAENKRLKQENTRLKRVRRVAGLPSIRVVRRLLPPNVPFTVPPNVSRCRRS